MIKFVFLVFFSAVFVSYLILLLRNAYLSKSFCLGGCNNKKVFTEKPPKDSKIPVKSKIRPQDWTLEELREYDGVKRKEILLALDWRVFDVSSAPHLYGPKGTYHYLGGRDATRNIVLLKEEITNQQNDSFDDYLDFTKEQRDALNDWVDFFYLKYPEVGILVSYKNPGAISTPYTTDNEVGGEIKKEIVFSTGINF